MSRISTPFGFSSTAADVTEGIDLTGKNALEPVNAERLWDLSLALLS